MRVVRFVPIHEESLYIEPKTRFLNEKKNSLSFPSVPHIHDTSGSVWSSCKEVRKGTQT